MKILLVNPKPIESYTVYGPSLGLCYLSSFLKSKGISNIEGVDLNIDSDTYFESAIRRADLVGVYCSTKALRQSFDVARFARESGKTVVFGGPHPSVLPEDVLNNPDVDYVILSEGEESFYALIQTLDHNGDVTSIDGIGYKRNGQSVINPKATTISNLDTIPFPDRDLFRFDYSKGVSFCATRGCPYKCANCQPALSMQTCAFRMRSVENVISELRQVAIGKLVHFIDNDLTVNKKWLRRFCERIIEEKLVFTWGCQGRVNTLNEELMALMKQAGCINIGIGIESGSQEMLDGFLRKQLTLERAKEVVAQSVKVQMPLHGWFIIGIPTETRADIEKTIQFALSHDFATVGFSIGTPWPGTMFHKVAMENGWVLSDNWEHFNEKRYSLLKTSHWGPEDIARYRSAIVKAFRKKDWIVHEDDFVFIDPYWGKNWCARFAIRILRVLRIYDTVRYSKRVLKNYFSK
jgi:radical SAM superfamily enzyme YgiQ (UPF0313 family)